MQGLVVVPLFGGFDERRDEGRLFYYDATGGRWEEDDYQATGSGGQPAKNSLKKRWRPGLDARRGGPGRRGGAARRVRGRRRHRRADPMRAHLPDRARRDRHRAPTRCPRPRSPTAVDAVLEERALMSFMPYVAPEQMMKDRSEYAHKGIARGRSVIGLEYADGLLFIAENPSRHAAQDQRDLRPIAFAGVGKYSEFEDLRIAGHPAGRPARATPTAARTSRPATSPTPTPRRCRRSSPSR